MNRGTLDPVVRSMRVQFLLELVCLELEIDPFKDERFNWIDMSKRVSELHKKMVDKLEEEQKIFPENAPES